MLSIINQIEFRHLSYFKVLAEELHFRKAAEKLFISPSALSQQISQLEDILKTELFERTNKKVSLQCRQPALQRSNAAVQQTEQYHQ